MKIVERNTVIELSKKDYEYIKYVGRLIEGLHNFVDVYDEDFEDLTKYLFNCDYEDGLKIGSTKYKFVVDGDEDRNEELPSAAENKNELDREKLISQLKCYCWRCGSCNKCVFNCKEYAHFCGFDELNDEELPQAFDLINKGE